jgi:hypothetical protein
MDIYKAIEELRAEKSRLDRAIAALEEDSASSAPSERRAWNANARKAAAERMRKYWERRKREAAAGAAGTNNGASGDHNVNPPSTESA